MAEELGVKDFWFHVLKNHKMFGGAMQEGDEDALRYLWGIESKLISGTINDFQLKFTFHPNPYFESSYITKKYFINESNTPVKVECSEVKWKAGK